MSIPHTFCTCLFCAQTDNLSMTMKIAYYTHCTQIQLKFSRLEKRVRVLPGILLSLWWEGMQPLQIRSTQQPCRSAESSQGSVPNKTSLFSIWKFQFSKSEICAFFCSKPRLNLEFTSSNFSSCLISDLFIISSHPGNVWTWQNMNSVVVTMKTAIQPQIMTHSPTDIWKRVQRSWLSCTLVG